MIIESTDTAKSLEMLGKDWKARLYIRGKRDTNIVHELWNKLCENRNKPYSELYNLLSESYRKRESKSRIEIYYEKDYIELTNKGVFPNISITKL